MWRGASEGKIEERKGSREAKKKQKDRQRGAHGCEEAK